MQNYELMVIYSPQMMTDSGATPKVTFEKLLKKLQIKITSEDDWGEKSLEYNIQGYDRGYYVVYEISMDEAKVSELTKRVKMEKGVLRWLVTSKEE